MFKFKLFLLFTAILISSKNIISMNGDYFNSKSNRYQPSHQEINDDESESSDDDVIQNECEICLIENPVYHKLSCGHSICRECLRGLLESCTDGDLMQLRCPDKTCMRRFTDHEYNHMNFIDHKLIARIKELVNEKGSKIEGDFRTKVWAYFNIKHCPGCNRMMQKNGGCKHMTCKCSHQFCWYCMGEWNHNGQSGYIYHKPCETRHGLKVAGTAIGAFALSAYASYKLVRGAIAAKNWFIKNHPKTVAKIKSTKDKVVSKIEDNAQILVPALTGAAVFGLLTATKSTLSNKLLNSAYQHLDSPFFKSSAGEALLHALTKPHLVNGSAGILAGLLVAGGSKLFNGSTKKQTLASKSKINK